MLSDLLSFAAGPFPSPTMGRGESAVPRYDYQCKRRHRYERQEPFGSPVTHPCEKCGEPARRLLHVPAISFKGSGWYKTDSRKTSYNDSDSNSDTASESDSSSSSSKSSKKSSSSSSNDSASSKGTSSKSGTAKGDTAKRSKSREQAAAD